MPIECSLDGSVTMYVPAASTEGGSGVEYVSKDGNSNATQTSYACSVPFFHGPANHAAKENAG